MTTRRLLLPLLLATCLLGCATDDPAASDDEALQTDAERGAADGSAAALSPDYLAGAWCFAYTEAGGERSAENITYEFGDDGTLRYQNTPEAAVEQAGTYHVVTAGTPRLRIEPTLMFLPDEVLEVSEDAFVLGSASTRLAFERGACG